jgi:hypothetical protein
MLHTDAYSDKRTQANEIEIEMPPRNRSATLGASPLSTASVKRPILE